MSTFEVVGGSDRRSLIKRFERKSKHDAVSQLVDFHLLNCTRIEKLEAELEALRSQASTYTDIRVELRQAQKAAELERQIQNAARDLPGAWSIQLCVEQGAGWVDLFDDDGCKIDFPDSCDGLATSVKDAVEHAICASKAGAP